MTKLTKLSKSSVDEVKRLRRRDYRRSTGLTIAEGHPEVKRASKAKVVIRTLYLCPEILQLKPNEIKAQETIYVSQKDFAKIAFGARLKGILAICKYPQRDILNFKVKDNPFVVVLEGVEKPGNIGTVIRTCDGAGVNAIILCDGRTDAFNHNIVRSSTGTVFHIPIFELNKTETLSFLKKHDMNILAATSNADEMYAEHDLTGPTALILGSEHEGLSDFWFEHAQKKIGIPMLGEADCLNVAMSACILIYEVRRQRIINKQSLTIGH